MASKIIGIHGTPQPQLLQVAHATDLLCFRLCAGESGQEHRRKNGDDRYDDQELYQGEPAGMFSASSPPTSKGTGQVHVISHVVSFGE